MMKNGTFPFCLYVQYVILSYEKKAKWFQWLMVIVGGVQATTEIGFHQNKSLCNVEQVKSFSLSPTLSIGLLNLRAKSRNGAETKCRVVLMLMWLPAKIMNDAGAALVDWLDRM